MRKENWQPFKAPCTKKRVNLLITWTSVFSSKKRLESLYASWVRESRPPWARNKRRCIIFKSAFQSYLHDMISLKALNQKGPELSYIQVLLVVRNKESGVYPRERSKMELHHWRDESLDRNVAADDCMFISLLETNKASGKLPCV